MNLKFCGGMYFWVMGWGVGDYARWNGVGKFLG